MASLDDRRMLATSFPVTFDDGTDEDVTLDEAAAVAAEAFREWYRSEGQEHREGYQ